MLFSFIGIFVCVVLASGLILGVSYLAACCNKESMCENELEEALSFSYILITLLIAILTAFFITSPQNFGYERIEETEIVEEVETPELNSEVIINVKG
jgi:uncharacterized membrane protein